MREPSTNPRRTAIVRLLRGEAAADRGTDVTAALAEQLLVLVTEQCASRPTILVVDDLQWADPASVTLWGRLARSARQVPLLLVGMMRPVPLREDLLALRRGVADADRLQLTALTDPATVDLIAALAGGKPDLDLLRLADGAAGNPLYLTELMAALARSSSLTLTDAGTVELAGDSAPSSLSAAIADRVGFVTGATREVLKAAALLGMQFAVDDLAIVLRRSVVDLIPAVDEACAAGVLAESGSGLGFRHPLIRAALYDEMPAPVRAAWHRDVGRALATAGAPPDRVARQLLQAVGGPGDTTEPVDNWMLDWLSRTADPLISQAPGVAAELLTRAVDGRSADSAQQAWLASGWPTPCTASVTGARPSRWRTGCSEHHCEPDLLVDLHWTLAQCRMLAGSSAESLAALELALSSPGLSARHRARLLVLAGRTHKYLGELDKAARSARRALAEATEADDGGAMALGAARTGVLASVRGELTDALPLYDRALTVTKTDPALTDLRLLLQINQAVTLGCLDQYERAFAAAGEARHLAGQLGTTFRLAQAHGALGQLLFETGQWDDALTELAIVPEDMKEPAAACWELGIAAVISFHRGDIELAQRRLAAAAPQAKRIGHRHVGPLALARSLDYERQGALPEALHALTEGFGGDTEELHEIEDLLADAVRLATETGDLATAHTFAGHAAALAAGSEIPHRQANALYCQGLLDHDPAQLLAAAARYEDAGGLCSGRRRWRPRPMSSSDTATGPKRGPRSPRRSRSTPAWGRRPTPPGCRPRSGPTASAADHGSSTGRRATAGTASRRPRLRSPPSSRTGCPTRRSPG